MPTFLKARLTSWRVGFRYKIPARLRCKAIWHMTALVHKWMHVLTSQGSATPDHWLFGHMLQSLWLGISTILWTHHCRQSIQMECICLQQHRSATCCIMFCPVRPHCSHGQHTHSANSREHYFKASVTDTISSPDPWTDPGNSMKICHYTSQHKHSEVLAIKTIRC